MYFCSTKYCINIFLYLYKEVTLVSCIELLHNSRAIVAKWCFVPAHNRNHNLCFRNSYFKLLTCSLLTCIILLINLYITLPSLLILKTCWIKYFTGISNWTIISNSIQSWDKRWIGHLSLPSILEDLSASHSIIGTLLHSKRDQTYYRNGQSS